MTPDEARAIAAPRRELTDERIWEIAREVFTGDECRRMGLSLNLFARAILREAK